jgi:hypothetical protein
MRIPNPKKNWGSPYPRTIQYLGGEMWVFSKVVQGTETRDMISKGLGELFEGDSADM